MRPLAQRYLLDNFLGLGLAQPLLAALTKFGYSKPTPIQAQAIPALMQGRDVVGIAQTGTGKTAAFALPILHHLLNNPKPAPHKGTRALILSPTRELASQIAQSFRDLSAGLDFKIAVIFGGVPPGAQIRALAHGLDVLVATPGRLIDHMDQHAADLREVEFLVLDEVDQMLDLGFVKPIRRIVKTVPKQRQNLFFSATMPTEIRALAAEMLRNPVEVAVTPIAKTADRVEQNVIFVDAAKKRDMLVELFKDPEFTPRSSSRAPSAAPIAFRRPSRRRAFLRRDPRQQEPGPARARACFLPRRQDARPRGDRYRRARHRHRRRQPCRQFRDAGSGRGLCPPHRPHRARWQGRQRDLAG